MWWSHKRIFNFSSFIHLLFLFTSVVLSDYQQLNSEHNLWTIFCRACLRCVGCMMPKPNLYCCALVMTKKIPFVFMICHRMLKASFCLHIFSSEYTFCSAAEEKKLLPMFFFLLGILSTRNMLIFFCPVQVFGEGKGVFQTRGSINSNWTWRPVFHWGWNGSSQCMEVVFWTKRHDWTNNCINYAVISSCTI